MQHTGGNGQHRTLRSGLWEEVRSWKGEMNRRVGGGTTGRVSTRKAFPKEEEGSHGVFKAGEKERERKNTKSSS